MKEAAITQIGLLNCTGCYGCYNVCAFKAIEMSKCNDGFYKPNILKDKCANCGLCAKKCAVLNPDYNNTDEPKFFMAWSNNPNTRKNSSSGGVFTELAENVLENQGDVYGVTWDEKLELHHIKVNSIEDLELLRGSKYLQSKINKAYKEIEETLKVSEKEVLFVGTPCQVAGLKKIVTHERLLTCDLLCHGVPSYLPFESHIESMEDEIKEVNFRDKTTGWTTYSLSYVGKQGVVKTVFSKDKFFMGFLKDFYLNEACYACKFSKLPRQGDITLGDFWGLDKKYDKKNEGVSVIISNNIKGDRALELLDKQGKITLDKVEKSSAVKDNQRIYSGHLKRPNQRDYFIKKVVAHGFKKVAKAEIHIPSKFEKELRKLASYSKKFIKKIIGKL